MGRSSYGRQPPAQRGRSSKAIFLQSRNVIFSPDGKLIASASENKIVKLWDVPTGIVRQTLKLNLRPTAGGHSYCISDPVAFSPDGKLGSVGIRPYGQAVGHSHGRSAADT